MQSIVAFRWFSSTSYVKSSTGRLLPNQAFQIFHARQIRVRDLKVSASDLEYSQIRRGKVFEYSQTLNLNVELLPITRGDCTCCTKEPKTMKAMTHLAAAIQVLPPPPFFGAQLHFGCNLS